MEEFQSVSALIESLKKLPGIGRKSAERMAYQILQMKPEKIDQMVTALKNARDNIDICPICGSFRENKNCPICSDMSRDQDTLIVVTSFKDLLAIEKINSYHGLYHVLGGNLSPTKGIGTKDINIEGLFNRVREGNLKEVILATDLTLDGETTALYIAKLLSSYPISVSRLAYGLPMGGQLEYADELTLAKSIEGRNFIKKEL